MKTILAGWRWAMVISVLAAFPVAAEEKPLNLSLFTPISLAKPEDSISAFRFNLIYGKNTSVKVVDLGMVNQTTSGLSNGLQWGVVNMTGGTFSGLQVAALNINQGTVKGLQWSGVNYAASAGGLQVAVVNYAEKLQGVQIGVINIIKHGGFLPVMVIANWSKKS